MALDFDGTSQYIDCGDTTSLDITGNHTIMVWAKIPASTIIEYLVCKYYYNGTNRYGYFMSLRINGVIFAGVYNGPFHYAYGTTILDDNVWHHLAYSYNTVSDITLFVDGVLEPASEVYGSNPGSVGLNNLPLTIAQYDNNGTKHYGKGTFFDARVYNRSLSANEIAEIYHKQGADKIWEGLVGWWRMDEKTTEQTASGASSVRDLSGNGNHGTPYNSPVYQQSPHRLRRGFKVL